MCCRVGRRGGRWIVGVVVNMNGWTRIKLAEGAIPGPA
jgi:hypothetical protein